MKDATSSFVACVKGDLSRLTHGSSTSLPFFIRLVGTYLLNPGFKAVLLFRCSHLLHRHRHFRLATLLMVRSLKLTGAEIYPNAEIGPGLVIKHPSGVVIGPGCQIGLDCTILQCVTLGEKYSQDDAHSYPRVGHQVTICAGAVLLGNISIGDRVLIGAHSTVVRDVPAGCRVAGTPARILTPSIAEVDQL